MKKIKDRTIAVLGFICILIIAGAIFLPADLEPAAINTVVAGVEGLKDELGHAQLLALPVADGHVDWDGGNCLFSPSAGDLSALFLLDSLVPVATGAGYSWPVTLFEDPVSRETVILDADGAEAMRLPPDPGYDPLWAFYLLYPVDGIMDPAAYDPSRVELSMRLLVDPDWLEWASVIASADTDGDGMPDGWEVAHGLDPLDAADAGLDADGDGLINAQEFLRGTDPNTYNDSDGDGMPDGWEVAHGLDPLDAADVSADPDSDGLTNLEEFLTGTGPDNPDSDGDGLSDGWELRRGLNPTDGSDGSQDTDGDGMPDAWEILHGLDPLYFPDAYSDTDGDELSNLQEYQMGTEPDHRESDGDGLDDYDEVFIYGTSPSNPDTDGDGMPDGWEVGKGLNPTSSDACWDNDSDGVYNSAEYFYNANPNTPDSDYDGLNDYEEIYFYGTNPSNPDSDGDGLNDYEEIYSFWTYPNNPDSDGDGLNDYDEIYYGADPFIWDSDSDGLNDYEEIYYYGTIPNNPDSDGDGLNDYDEVYYYGTIPNNPDSDGDGLNDDDEIYYGSNPGNPDSDGDGMPDGWEVAHGLDPLDAADAVPDSDGDGLDDFLEVFIYGTNPGNPDSDGDGMPDCWEVLHGRDPLDAADAGQDADGDGLTNLQEYQTGTDPENPDSDGDGLSDAEERPNVIVRNDFPWFDVSGGTSLPVYSYVPQQTVNLPFPVWFDGAERSQATIGCNGWLALLTPGMGGACFPNDDNPSYGKIGPDHVFILGYHTSQALSWRFDQVQSVVLADVTTNGSRYCVIEYCLKSRWSSENGKVTFQTIIPFATSNQVTVSFLEAYGLANGSSASLAVQSPATMRRAVYSYLGQADSVYPGLSVTYHLVRTGTDPLKADTDGDGMPDKWELDNWLNPTDAADAERDLDTDGLINLSEYFHGTSLRGSDSDADGMPDAWEVSHQFNPLDPADALTDRDSDGLSNVLEYQNSSDPSNPDTDGDGLDDNVEINVTHTSVKVADSDNDGLLDGAEANRADPLDPKNSDTDGDGLKDGEEVYTYGTNPNLADTDGDGLSDKEEVFIFLTDPNMEDTDDDGLSDWLEVHVYFTNPKRADTDWDGVTDLLEVTSWGDSMNPRKWDTDGDGLSDGAEISTYGTSVYSWDTDGDGLSDGEEVRLYGTDPTKLDSDSDGIFDGEQLAASDSWVPPVPVTRVRDYDGDGLSDQDEALHSTMIDNPDSDYDGIPDGWEVLHLLNPLSHAEWTDSDIDGLTDYQEYIYGCDPWDGDTDDDGLSDGDEIIWNANPGNPDTDGDGLPDDEEVNIHSTNPNLADSDGDGLSDYYEVFYQTDPDNPDSDLDGKTDAWEVRYGFDPLDGTDIGADTDGDGLPDVLEARLNTNPDSADTDGDGLLDVWEVRYGFDPLTWNEFWLDSDYDNLPDYEEQAYGTDPFNGDTDYDGLSDYNEIHGYSREVGYACYMYYASVHGYGFLYNYGYVYYNGCDPLQADTDGDGIPDGWECEHGTDPTYPNASDDLDGEGLSNLDEYICGSDPWNYDTDGDMVTDYEEYGGKMNPHSGDTDGDGLSDYDESCYFNTDPNMADADQDGLSDYEEVYGMLNHGNSTNPSEWDTDGDGLADGDEIRCGLNPNDQNDAIGDSDGDGINNATECLYGTNAFNPDSDGDGMPDLWEVSKGLNPIINSKTQDADGDRLTNFREYQLGTEPCNTDTDGDGMPDGWEVRYGFDPLVIVNSDISADSDSDGLANLQESQNNTDPLKSDTDGDGMPDLWEISKGLNPVIISKTQDADGDGLTNFREYQIGTEPCNPDTDGDGMSDGWEVRYGFDPLVNSGASADPDSDGLSNIQESQNNANPRKADTDGDGISDSQELALGTSPRLPDTDGDGMPDGWEDTYRGSGFDPLAFNDNRLEDLDGDRLVNWYEGLKGTDPGEPDTDGDGISDWDEFFNVVRGIPVTDNNGNGISDEWESSYPSIWEQYGTVNLSADPDNDGVDNFHEYKAGTDPLKSDTDGDWTGDGEELFTYYTSPVNPDTDGDGITDYAERYVHGTDALAPDTDGDGLFDGEEVNQFSTNPALFSSDGSGMSDLWNILGGQIPAEWPAPSVPAFGGTVPVTLSTHLDSAAADAVGLLRIGDNFIHVRPGDLAEITISLPATGRSLFTYVPGPGCSTADKPVITVTQAGRLAVFNDPGNLVQLLDTFALPLEESAARQPSVFVGGAIGFPPFTVTPDRICTHDSQGSMISLQSPDPKVRFLVGNSLLLAYSPRPPKHGDPVTCYITYTDPVAKIFHAPFTVDYCHCQTPDDPDGAGSTGTDCFCNCCHVCCDCWLFGCDCTPGNCSCQTSCIHDGPSLSCAYCGSTSGSQSGDPLQCGIGCAAPGGNCHVDPNCRCFTCPACGSHRCDYASYTACRFECGGHYFWGPYGTDESNCACRDIPHAYECPCTVKYPDALLLCPCDHRYRSMDDRGHKVLRVGKSDAIGVVLQNGSVPCPNCQHALSCSSGCSVTERRGPIAVNPGARSTTGEFVVSPAGAGLSTQIGDAFVACRTFAQGSGGNDVTYILQRYTVLGLDVYPKMAGKTVEESPYWPQQVMPTPPEDELLLNKMLNDRNAIRLATKIKLPGNCGTVTVESTGVGCYLYIKNQLSNPTCSPDLLLTPETRSANFSLTDWKRMYCDTLNFSMAHLICTQPGVGSIKITFNTNDGQSEAITITAEQKFTAVSMGIVPDYDRDGKILEADCSLAKAGEYFRLWINDDKDVGDVDAAGGTDVPGQTSDPNCNSVTLNGRRDLLDFFPVLIDIGDFESLCGAPDSYRIKQADKAVNIVCTSLDENSAGWYLTKDIVNCGMGLQDPLATTAILNVGDEGYTLTPAFMEWLRQAGGKGVFLVEGAKASYAPLVLEAIKGGQVIFSSELPLFVSPVEEMFERANIRDGAAAALTGGSMPPGNGKNVIFLHGFNVPENETRGAHAEMFKRLWQSGCNARFHGVTWRGDYSVLGLPPFHFQQNVNFAFEAAVHLKNYVTDNIGGDKIILAHSLGNMVVSSAITDHGLCVGKYFMFNSAIAAEAFDVSQWSDVGAGNVMVPTAWANYPSQTWSARWNEFFAAPDDRSKLTWTNRFAVVPSQTTLYNYYSGGDGGGDEVLELYTEAPSNFSEVNSPPHLMETLGRFAWHKQETHKGLGSSNPSGTPWAGWGFGNPGYTEHNPPIVHFYYPDAAAAALAPPAQLRDIPVFKKTPDEMFVSPITPPLQNEILARGIPALSGPTGSRSINIPGTTGRNRDINDFSSDWRPNGWPRSEDDLPFRQRWRHGDWKDVAYFYNFKVYEDVVTKGGLK